ncbi:MAG: hypothetical protein JNK67_04295 [Alphaproteobacteria bacterium]|nr:hypothetical protein [Alphaproteobacteria bacterium]
MTTLATTPPIPHSSALSARSVRIAAGALVAVLVLAWLPVHATLPLGRDQAIIGRVTQVLLDGGWPYADAWDHKGPAAYLLYAPAYLLFGRHEHAIVRFDLLLLLGFAWVCGRIGRALDQRATGLLAAVATVLTVRNDYWTFGQPDAWVGYLFVGVAALLCERDLGRRPWAGLVAGIAVGAAAMVKPVYAVMIVLPLAAWIWQPAGERRPSFVALTLLGAAAVILGFAAVFAAGGHLDALWQTYILFNLGAHLTRTWDDMTRIALSFAVTLVAPRFDFGLTVVLGAAAAGFAAMRRRHRRTADLLGLGWLLALVSVIAQGKGFPYHFAAVHGFTGVFAGYFVAQRFDAHFAAPAAARTRGANRRRATMAGALIGLAACAMQPHGQRVRDWWLTLAGAMSEAERAQRLCESDYCPWRLRALGEVIRRETAPGEPIFVWGFDSAIYLYADRPATGRFGFSYPLIGGTETWRRQARAELMATLAATPPRVIVVQEDDFIRLMHTRPSVDHILDFPEFGALLARHYVPEHDLGRFVVHRRRD